MEDLSLVRKGRMLERLFFALIAIVLGLLFLDLFRVLQKDFKDVPGRLSAGTIVNLNEPDASTLLGRLLEKGYYFEDRRDIAVITSSVAEGLAAREDKIDNIGELNKGIYNVEAEQAYARGGQSFRKRVALSRSLLGFAGADSVRFLSERTAPPVLTATADLASGKGTIGGNVTANSGRAAAGVLVRLQMLIPQDSLYSSEVSEVENIRVQENARV
ncbi:MAG TPA: hypothetical protein VM843_08920, partial [Flavisolibacter sp.]|nr:hypothetical protein [Flavisolibacter sp.]